jgi:hypothetical protein
VPSLAGYAAAHGLRYRDVSMALPKATQLMRHGFMQEVKGMASGDLPGGLENGWLANVNYVYEGRSDLERSPFTLALVEAAKSSEYAVRELCHDKGLSKRDRSNPDSDRQVVELDDTAVRLESDVFLERYAVSTDHDQDQLSVWQLFSPSLIQWLSSEAPDGFSFELQDGALCCFVPGFSAEEAELDALCAGATRVFERVMKIDGQGAAEMIKPGSRVDQVEQELAAHPFAAPPKSAKAAAKEFRHGLVIGDRAWALGAEAFFRSHATQAGFKPIATSAFRASHVDTFLPGVLAHVAQGSVGGGDGEDFLIFSNDESYEDMGWSALVVDLLSPLEGLAMVQANPVGDRAKRGLIQVGTDGRSLILTALDGGARDRSAEELDAFLAGADHLLRMMRE